MIGSDDTSLGQVVLYQAADGVVQLEVRLERESLWLSQRQMSTLFDKDRDTIGLHLRNIFEEGELIESATTEESSVVQQEGRRQVRRKVRLYNLDAIISVGYRVNSIRGTQFRIWATRVLRDHLLQGYTINQARLRDLNRAVRLIADTTQRRDLSGDEAKALLTVVGDYHRALGLLDDYDHQRVSKAPARATLLHPLEYEEALRVVEQQQTNRCCPVPLVSGTQRNVERPRRSRHNFRRDARSRDAADSREPARREGCSGPDRNSPAVLRRMGVIESYYDVPISLSGGTGPGAGGAAGAPDCV